MITLIMLTIVAVIMLLIGFFDIRLPFINRDGVVNKKVLSANTGNKDVKTVGNEPVESLKAFYRTVRAENWLSNTQRRMSSDVA